MSFKIKSSIIVVGFLILSSIAISQFSVVVHAEEEPLMDGRDCQTCQRFAQMESVAIGDKIYVVGELNNQEQATDTVFIFDTLENSWISVTSMLLSLHHIGAAYPDGKKDRTE